MYVWDICGCHHWGHPGIECGARNAGHPPTVPRTASEDNLVLSVHGAVGRDLTSGHLDGTKRTQGPRCQRCAMGH